MTSGHSWHSGRMRIAEARRSAPFPLRATLPVVRTMLRVLAVAFLVSAVVAMHSLGLGHGPMAAAHSQTTGAMGATEMVDMAGAASGRLSDAVTTVVAVVDDPSQGMAAICLAVLPLLVLLMARWLGWRVKEPARAVRRPGLGGFTASGRAPPAHLCPSLVKLCILRT